MLKDYFEFMKKFGYNIEYDILKAKFKDVIQKSFAKIEELHDKTL